MHLSRLCPIRPTSPDRRQRLTAFALAWRVLGLAALGLTGQFVQADTPPGWISAENVSAYTTTAGELQVAFSGLRVNDTIDFLDVRDDLLAGNRSLVGDSGDLSGGRLQLDYGITPWLSVFYREQRQALTVDLGEISSLNVVDIDNSLDSTLRSAGFKWTVYARDLQQPNNRRGALSLEVSAFDNASDPFDVIVDEIRIQGITVSFADPEAFSVAELEDDGWQARMIYSQPLSAQIVASVWAGYGESDSTSQTTTSVTFAAIADLVTQQFSREERYLSFGAGLTWQWSARLPIQLRYQVTDIDQQAFARSPADPPSGLPSFLRSDGAQIADHNHTLLGRVSYWLSPRLQVGLVGELMSNQFSGIIPHFNNPLSESFSDLHYGFIGVELGLRW